MGNERKFGVPQILFGSSRFERESMGVYAYVKIYMFFFDLESGAGSEDPGGQPAPKMDNQARGSASTGPRMGNHRRKKHERPQGESI